jgi:mannitol operon transcriptional antiterminator
MHIPLTSRQCDIAQVLLRASQPLTLAEIGEQLGLSGRVVRHNLRVVEAWLESNGTVLARSRNLGIQVLASPDFRETLRRELETSSSRTLVLDALERQQAVALWLLTASQPLVASELARNLGVCRATVYRDLDALDDSLQAQGLRLIRRPRMGCSVEGTEGKRRQQILDLLCEILDQRDLLSLCEGGAPQSKASLVGDWVSDKALAYLELLELSLAKHVMSEASIRLGYVFADSSFVDLILLLAISIDRMRQGRTVQGIPGSAEELKGRAEFNVACTVLAEVERTLGLCVPESEVFFLTVRLLGAKLKGVVPVGSSRHMAQPEVLEVVDSLISEASVYLHPWLKMDQELSTALALHLQRVFNRLRFGLPISNPLLRLVKKEYPYVFQIAARACDRLSLPGVGEVPEEEVGFLAMHLGAAMERLKSRPRLRVLVVCGEGIATAWLLVSRLRVELPELDIVEVTSAWDLNLERFSDKHLDAVVSTLPLATDALPVIEVSPFLRPAEVTRIRECLGLDDPGVEGKAPLEGRTRELADLITERTVEVRVPVDTWESLVDRVGRLLVGVGGVEQRYVGAMKKAVREFGPYVVIAPRVALLHAHPADGVRRVCMSLVTPERPVPFGHPTNDPVEVAVGLGTTDDCSHVRALRQLMEFLGDGGLVERIASSRSSQDLLEVLGCLDGTAVGQ